MSRLSDSRTEYLAALAAAEAARVAYVDAIERERDDGRTLEDIGSELGIGRSNVCRTLSRARRRAEEVT